MTKALLPAGDCWQENTQGFTKAAPLLCVWAAHIHTDLKTYAREIQKNFTGIIADLHIVENTMYLDTF